ncbi:MAG: hypothetical protein KGZ65_00255 [Sphingomonadales bacterium]|nr:hypothetical protein [Sphingomonadaceae bacterium]MBS3929637.1 hypothetical protein [Sphingomonadales bacterium]
MDENAERLPLAHEIRQPLNILRLVCTNLRGRLVPLLDPSESEYLEHKLARIEEQITRIDELLTEK